MNFLKLKVALWKEGEYYVSQCLNVNVASFGKTKKEALANLDEALELYFEDVNVVNSPNLGEVKSPELVNLNFRYA